MYDVITVCHYIAYYCHLKSYELTNLRLQKILYFLQLFFLDKNGKPCFHNLMEAWDMGPVVPDAYHHYKKYGPQFIPGEKTTDIYEIKENDREVISFVVSALSKYSTFQLIDITHKQMPWKKNYVHYDSNKISVDDMKGFVKESKQQ